ncbi:hypothetical protein L9F63_008517 [Diploptera punctata]|uniref:Vesicle transport protein n=1 Tax=Diploptera punctata TaxID=6984 RepID=A0AAD7Z5Z4_DIPPU|nr:hypothetical protein L9F63_008517 [Diploptera punctata]
MADLKKELDDYLSRNDSKSQLKITLPTLLTKSDVGKWFSKSGNNDESSTGLLTEAQKDYCPSLSKFSLIIGFCTCIMMGLFCFVLAAMYTPVLLLKARKFALLYTMGSLFTICSFSFLWGPMNHLRHLFSRERLPFTVAYFGTLFGTLYFALSVQSTPLTVLFAVGQIMALLWFLISYIPGGQTGLQFFTRLFSSAVTNTVSKTLPV